MMFKCIYRAPPNSTDPTETNLPVGQGPAGHVPASHMSNLSKQAQHCFFASLLCSFPERPGRHGERAQPSLDVQMSQ